MSFNKPKLKHAIWVLICHANLSKGASGRDFCQTETRGKTNEQNALFVLTNFLVPCRVPRNERLFISRRTSKVKKAMFVIERRICFFGWMRLMNVRCRIAETSIGCTSTEWYLGRSAEFEWMKKPYIVLPLLHTSRIILKKCRSATTK